VPGTPGATKGALTSTVAPGGVDGTAMVLGPNAPPVRVPVRPDQFEVPQLRIRLLADRLRRTF
jgi:hypothetical protein